MDHGAGSWLGPTACVKGDISGSGDLLIYGSVEGTIKLEERKLTVGSSAKVTGNISAGDVVAHGFVKGDVRATGRIEIKKDGSVTGNLTAAQITVEDGAGCKGFLEIERNAVKKTEIKGGVRAASAGAGRGKG